MTLDERFRTHLRTVLARIDDEVVASRSLSKGERTTHLADLVGLLHAAVALQRELQGAPHDWAAEHREVEDAIHVLGARIRILADGNRGDARA
jgi:hypothetical protein